MLAGLGRFFRQTIVTSAWADPDVARLFRRASSNTRGGILLRGSYAGTISAVGVPVRQVFSRVQPVARIADADDVRFAQFSGSILPAILAGVDTDATGAAGSTARTLIYVPSYFDYVRLRNLLDAHEAEFVTCSEYSEDADVARARSRFQSGASPIMLLTERFHYFNRLRIRGARHVLFYGPPNVPHFYADFVNMLTGAGGAGAAATSVTLYFTRVDADALERMGGASWAPTMLAESEKVEYVFV